MADRIASFDQLSRPNIYIVRMAVFLGVIGVIMVPIYAPLYEAFEANIFINSVILAALFIGIIFSFRQVATLFPEIAWVNTIRFSDPGIEVNAPPVLLAPMAALLRDRSGPVMLTTQTMRSIVESVAMRLDEKRDLSRYMIGLLVFLGLLGTFYGLLNTVSSVADTIKGLSLNDSEFNVFFDNLQDGLEAPLSGMGTAFSSSLFGLAGSLILGFLDLQASGAQNRFHVELEDWLSTVTDISVDGETSHHISVESLPRLIASLEKYTENANGVSADPDAAKRVNEGLLKLADSLTNVLKTVKQDQIMTQKYMQFQADQTKKLNETLQDLNSKLGD